MQKMDSVAKILASFPAQSPPEEWPTSLVDEILYAANVSREHEWMLQLTSKLPRERQLAYSEYRIAALFGLGQKQAARDEWFAWFNQRATGSEQPPLAHMGQWAVRLSLQEEAEQLCQHLTSKTPQFDNLCADIARLQQEFHEAERLYQLAISQSPPQLTPCVSLAWLYQKCEQPVSAMIHAVAAQDLLNASGPDATFTLLECEALHSLRSFFQRTRRRKNIRELQRKTRDISQRTLDQLRESCLVQLPLQQFAPPPPKHSNWDKVAKDTFGIEQLREAQRQTLQRLDEGCDVLSIMPTGSGKSLCYQLPASEGGGTVLVVSPLVSLMQDQVASLPPALQQRAEALHSGREEEAQWQIMQQLAAGELDLIFAAPERLRHQPFRAALTKANIKLMVVDEAHCVSIWGHDFRPDYLALGALRKALGEPQLLALTATAPPSIRTEIQTQLGGARPLAICTTSQRRENLWLEVLWLERQQQRNQLLVSLCQTTEGAGIIYARSRQRCEELATMLNAYGVRATPYHAGLPDRASRQALFMSGEIQVVVATIAFGMGINKPDIRFVFHDEPPNSIEDLTQQIGRAGRDGQPSRCTLLATKSSIRKLYQSAHKEWDFDTLWDVYTTLKNKLEDVELALFTPATLAATLLLDETRARVAVSLLCRAGLLSRGTDLPHSIMVQRMDRFQRPEQQTDNDFTSFIKKSELPERRPLITSLLELANRTAVTPEKLLALLHRWNERGDVMYEPRSWRMSLRLGSIDECQGSKQLQQLLHTQEKHQQQRATAMLEYMRNHTCRHETVLCHLESHEETSHRRQMGWPCQSCDVCHEKR